jgi:hypothetical protein
METTVVLSCYAGVSEVRNSVTFEWKVCPHCGANKWWIIIVGNPEMIEPRDMLECWECHHKAWRKYDETAH